MSLLSRPLHYRAQRRGVTAYVRAAIPGEIGLILSAIHVAVLAFWDLCALSKETHRVRPAMFWCLWDRTMVAPSGRGLAAAIGGAGPPSVLLAPPSAITDSNGKHHYPEAGACGRSGIVGRGSAG